MGTKTITSAPFVMTQLEFPGLNRNLNFRTRTTFTPDVNGNPINGTATTVLEYQVTPGGIFNDAATSTKGGEPGSWSFTIVDRVLFPDTPLLGESARRSLQTKGGALNQATQNSIIQSANSAGIRGAYRNPLASSLRNTAQSPPRPPSGGTPPGANPEGGSQRSGGTDGTGTPSETSTPINVLGNIENPAGRTFKVAPNGLYYPENVKRGTKDKPGSGQDLIRFTAQALEKREGATSSTSDEVNLNFKFGDPFYTPVDGSIFLPIQSPISDQNSVDWGGNPIDAISSAAYSASLNISNTNFSEMASKVGGIKDKILHSVGTYKERIRKVIAAEAASVNNILARTDNVILNPNLELLFNSPTLRSFNFQFKLSARRKSEADIIKKIIKYFKYHSAVREEGGLFLKAPDVFEIKYCWWNGSDYNQNHPGLNKIKKVCALTTFSVDYTPLGSYTTYNDGSMVAYTLNMQFQEIIPIYDTDYSKVEENHPIGY